jgi:hypothetical protein
MTFRRRFNKYQVLYALIALAVIVGAKLMGWV